MKAFKETAKTALLPVLALSFLIFGAAAVAEVPATSRAGFQLGNLLEAAPIPGTFGPFNSRTAGVGIYRGRLRVTADDLKGDNKFLVIRMQSDKTHRFGWIRGFIGNQLVATEAQQKENRIVEDVTKFLKPGDSVITLMGSAYPGTAVDFYIVPKETVLSVLQGKALGNIVFTSGAIQAAGKGQDTFGDSFELSESELSGRLFLTVKSANNNGKAFSWIRGSVNGTPIISEQNFNVGEGTVDISNYVKKGSNRLDFQAAAAPGSVFGFYVSQLSRLNSEQAKSSTPALSASSKPTGVPVISRMNPTREVKSGAQLEITGRGFDRASTKVFLDDFAIAPKAVTDNQITVVIPGEIFSGQYRLTVVSGGQKSDSLPVIVSGVPKVSSLNPKEAAAGRELEIRGENFSERPGDLKVDIGGRAARVLSSTRQQILVLVPSLPEATDAPVKVSVSGVPSTDEIKLRFTGEE